MVAAPAAAPFESFLPSASVICLSSAIARARPRIDLPRLRSSPSRLEPEGQLPAHE
jgi:hypothetical protein